MDEENQEVTDQESFEPLSLWVKLLLSCAILGFLLFVILPVSIWYLVAKSVRGLWKFIKKLFTKKRFVLSEGTQYYDECYVGDGYAGYEP